MNCWIIGVTFMCANGFGPVFIQNYNTQYEQPQRPAQINYPKLYKDAGWQSNYDYFCKGRNVKPEDKWMCK